jgi:hypothetical protein
MNLIAALPRMLLVLVEAMPRDTSNPFKSKSSSSAINPETMLLPSEIELQHNVVLSIGRFMFCMTLARHHVLQTGFLPALIELSSSRTIKVRQNAAICIFYLVQVCGHFSALELCGGARCANAAVCVVCVSAGQGGAGAFWESPK